MNKLITIFLCIITINTFELNQFEKKELRMFKNFLQRKNLKIDEDKLLYRFRKYQIAQRKLKELQKSVNFELELNQFSYLNEEEIRSRIGVGVDGDYDEYQHLLKQINKHPEKLEKLIKFRINNKMRAMKIDRRIRRLRYCKKKENTHKQKCKQYRKYNKKQNEENDIVSLDKDIYRDALDDESDKDALVDELDDEFYNDLDNDGIDEYDREVIFEESDNESENTNHIKNPFPENTVFYRLFEMGGYELLDVDWERDGFVTPIKDQGYCGSSYAFTPIAVIESAFLMDKGKLLDLSEQEIIDNQINELNFINEINERDPCAGGYIRDGFEYVKNNGIVEERYNKYRHKNDLFDHYGASKDETNREDDLKEIYNIYDYIGLKDDSMLTFLTNLSYRPLTAIIKINDEFLMYKKGIMDLSSVCYGNNYFLNATVAVGYYIDPINLDNSYIRFKNSWGTSWGEQGYFRIKLFNTSDSSSLQCELESNLFHSYYAITQ